MLNALDGCIPEAQHHTKASITTKNKSFSNTKIYLQSDTEN